MISALTRPSARLLVAAVVLLTPLLIACDDTETEGPPVELVVTVQEWSGWDPEHEARPETHTLRGEVGEELAVELFGDEMTISVSKVDGGELTVQTSNAMAPDTGSGINLNDLEDTFVVTADEPASFSTPSMDAGYAIEISVSE